MRTRKTLVILVSGKAGSGKNVVAEKLVAKLTDIPSMTVLPYGFADPIKYIAKAYLGWDEEKDERGRRLLQKIGADGREYDQDIWVKHFLNQLDKRAEMFPFNFAVISDWRFPNEYAFLLKNPLIDVVTVRVFGRGGLDGENALDISENSLPEVSKESSSWNYDFVVDNSGTLEELDSKVDKILSSISEQYIVE